LKFIQAKVVQTRS